MRLLPDPRLHRLAVALATALGVLAGPPPCAGGSPPTTRTRCRPRATADGWWRSSSSTLWGGRSPAAFRDANPAVEASLAPDLRAPYRMFLGAVREAVLRAHFTPASVGRCPARQLVEVPFTFTTSR